MCKSCTVQNMLQKSQTVYHSANNSKNGGMFEVLFISFFESVGFMAFCQFTSNITNILIFNFSFSNQFSYNPTYPTYPTLYTIYYILNNIIIIIKRDRSICNAYKCVD